MIEMPSQISKLLPQKDIVIGLDIGCSSIKLAQFMRRAGGLTLTKLKLQEIDLQKEMHEGQLAALKDLFKDIQTQQARVNVVINCPQSLIRILTIPYMPKSEIPEALKWQMKDFISFSVDEAVLDYEILQEIVEGGVKKLKVAAACSLKQTVNMYLDLLNQAEIQPALFTLMGFALENIIGNLTEAENKSIAVLDIGCNFSELFIFQGKKLGFSRKLPIAGQNFTQGMSQVLTSELGRTALSFQEAEQIKKKYGIPQALSSDVLEGKINSAQLFSLLRPNLEKLTEEVSRSFDFYREKEQGPSPEALILLGGGSTLKGLIKNLSASLDIPVKLGNPLSSFNQPSLAKDKLKLAPCFAQSLGAALSPPDAVNLLPVEIKEQTKLLVERSSIKAVVTALIMIMILSYIGMRIRLGSYNRSVAAAELELGARASQVEQVRKQAFLGALLKQRLYWSDALKEISNRIPEQIRLTEWDAAKNRLILKGEIDSADLAEEKVFTEFMNSLEKGIFKEVSLISSKKGLSRDKPYTFKLGLSIE